MKKISLIVFYIIGNMAVLFSQNSAPVNWQTLDPRFNNVYGTGCEEAYRLLQGKSSKPVIVAVIDSGVDPNHEDLKDIIWLNKGEIADNGMDDDKNGYVDDVHGWSFLGGKNGDIGREATEVARLYSKYKVKYKDIDTTRLVSEADKKDYEYYKKIRTEYLTELIENQQELTYISLISSFIDKVKKQNNGVFSKEALKNYTPENEGDEQLAKSLRLALNYGLKAEDLEKEVSEGTEHYVNAIASSTINADSLRKAIVGDDIENVNERYYGNNHIQGPDATHGTHVAGIIAAVRGNNKGIKGIANNVSIMIIRAVPDGDERDKDVANAIYYAVDNGAKVINMSFGKYYSPQKEAVDRAVRYAESKDVLLVHAAGNESKNKDVEMSYPSKQLLDGSIAGNWIDIGANSYKKSKNIVAPFSNYGKKTVDIFAPGVDIYSTTPGSKYEEESGTSMASPSAAGVAALIRSYFPELTAKQVKDVLMETAQPVRQRVYVPGATRKRFMFKKLGPKKIKKNFKELSVAGGVVNANNAVKKLLSQKK